MQRRGRRACAVGVSEDGIHVGTPGDNGRTFLVARAICVYEFWAWGSNRDEALLPAVLPEGLPVQREDLARVVGPRKQFGALRTEYA